MKTSIKMKAILAAYDELNSRRAYRRTYQGWPDAAAREANLRTWVQSAEDEFNRCSATLTEAIRAAEGRASARCLDAMDTARALKAVEDNLRIPAKYMRGIKVVICPEARDFPSAYRYTPEATVFCAEYKSAGWVITEIYRDVCPRKNKEFRVELTEDAKAAVIDRLYWNR